MDKIKVAEILDSVANYIETIENEESITVEKKAEELKNAETKERDDLLTPIIEKIAEEDREVIKSANKDILKVLNKTLSKESQTEDWGKLEVVKKGGVKEVDPIEAFAMS